MLRSMGLSWTQRTFLTYDISRLVGKRVVVSTDADDLCLEVQGRLRYEHNSKCYWVHTRSGSASFWGDDVLFVDGRIITIRGR